MVSTLRRVLVGTVVLMGLAQASLGKSLNHLRTRQWQQAVNDVDRDHGYDGAKTPSGDGSDVDNDNNKRYVGVVEGRSLKSIRDPQCNLPVEDPCTLITTAIGMVESGFATYYDEYCEQNGNEGCFTDNIPSCRTCYLSTDIYMAATNTTEESRPDWAPCPCCVPTTLEDSHIDVEVKAFNYTVFGISESACTDAPTPAPAPTLPPTSAPSPPPAAPTTPAATGAPVVPATGAPVVPATGAPVAPTPATPEPTVAAAAPVADGGGGATVTPAPEAASRALGSPAPSVVATPVATPVPSASSTGTSTEPGDVGNEATTENLDSVDGDDGLSTGAKIGIGAGAAVGVILLGATGFGILKASRTTSA